MVSVTLKITFPKCADVVDPRDYPTDLSSIQSYAQQLVEARQFAGVAWSVDVNSTVVAAGETGYSDHALTQPLLADTIYRIYSMTKPVVSVLCLILLDEGKLKLNDPISRWVPKLEKPTVAQADGSYQPATRSITILDLLTHRAGFSYDFLPSCEIAKRYRNHQLAENGSHSLDQLVSILCDEPLAMQPGRRWYYSYATDVLACIIQRVTGMSIAQAMSSRLFEPLGMSDTGFCVPQSDQSRVADMFGQCRLGDVGDPNITVNDLQPMSVEQSYPVHDEQFMRGGIGLYSTLTDYRKFMQILFDGTSAAAEQLLSPSVVDLMWRNQLEPDQMPIAIGANMFAGYGWGLMGRVLVDDTKADGISANGEGGWSGAASTHFWVDRRNNFSGIVMAQYLGSAIPLGADVQSLAYQALDEEFAKR